MEHPGFFDRAGPFSVASVAKSVGADLGTDADPDLEIADVQPLTDASAGDLTFIDNPKYLPSLSETKASACIVAPKFVRKLPKGTTPLIMREPYRGFAAAIALFYPQSLRPKTAGPFDEGRAANGVHQSAVLEDGVTIEPGAVIGPEAQIGQGTTIAAGAVIGYRVHIGRDSYVGPNATITHALIGNGVILHAGVAIGQDGFGFAMGREGHMKVPQIGRVVVQDDVEIGANSTVDRGALRDIALEVQLYALDVLWVLP
ncbi:MAG: UDP-3-O-(3-hydroxymyristoyl)glucosamine N-acyltransferase [Pseudomonadota bacterium]